MLKQLPNALTLMRLMLAPVIAWLWWQAAQHSQLIDIVEPPDASDFLAERANAFALNAGLSAVLFIIAALTDFFDGMAARAFDAHSKFGRLIDPIADKALVGLPLVAIVLGMWSGTPFPFVPVVTLAVAIIVLRDVGMTLIRLSASDGEGVRVSSLAKVKTALELGVVGVFLLAAAIRPYLPLPTDVDGIVNAIHLTDYLEMAWVALLVLAAALSAYTAFQYLAPRRKA